MKISLVLVSVLFLLSCSSEADNPMIADSTGSTDSSSSSDSTGSSGGNLCENLKKSSPVKEYFEVTECLLNNDNNYMRHECRPKAEFKKFFSECKDEPLTCNLTPKVIMSDTPDGYEEMVVKMLRMHDKKMVDDIFHNPRFNQYYAGTCMSIERHYYMEMILALGIIGDEDHSEVLDKLLDSDWKVKTTAGGKDIRMNIARAYWWLGNKDADEQLMKMLTMESIKDHPGREYRETILATLTEWDSDIAVDFCSDNLREIKKDGDLGACMLYLAHQGEDRATKKIIRQSETAGRIAYQALGILANSDAIEFLEEKKADEEGNGNALFYINLALANAGESDAWDDVEKHLLRNSFPGEDSLKALGFLSTNKSAAKTAYKFLAEHEADWKKERKERYALSVGMRVQLGDDSAVDEVIKLLENSDYQVRQNVVDAIGGRWGNVWKGMPGRGVATQEDLLEGLAEAHESEDREGIRESMSAAMLNIRAIIRAD